jgi:hypothetical protein
MRDFTTRGKFWPVEESLTKEYADEIQDLEDEIIRHAAFSRAASLDLQYSFLFLLPPTVGFEIE